MRAWECSSICLRCGLRVGAEGKAQRLLVKLKCKYFEVFLFFFFAVKVTLIQKVLVTVDWVYKCLVHIHEAFTSFGTLFILGEI